MRVDLSWLEVKVFKTSDLRPSSLTPWRTVEGQLKVNFTLVTHAFLENKVLLLCMETSRPLSVRLSVKVDRRSGPDLELIKLEGRVEGVACLPVPIAIKETRGLEAVRYSLQQAIYLIQNFLSGAPLPQLPLVTPLASVFVKFVPWKEARGIYVDLEIVHGKRTYRFNKLMYLMFVKRDICLEAVPNKKVIIPPERVALKVRNKCKKTEEVKISIMKDVPPIYREEEIHKFSVPGEGVREEEIVVDDLDVNAVGVVIRRGNPIAFIPLFSPLKYWKYMEVRTTGSGVCLSPPPFYLFKDKVEGEVHLRLIVEEEVSLSPNGFADSAFLVTNKLNFSNCFKLRGKVLAPNATYKLKLRAGGRAEVELEERLRMNE